MLECCGSIALCSNLPKQYNFQQSVMYAIMLNCLSSMKT
ncbi:hypothetical protein PVAP13_3KG023227 [Panicum virgatum]|uniref:Uncharacterized protein n=1 Tax=Panicum virgatum TaxID=38727 RepID=A0A8T0UKX4_PANVG|nr:hypothetical protein PVAP13_3KG023227 [Panicum virgatum]